MAKLMEEQLKCPLYFLALGLERRNLKILRKQGQNSKLLLLVLLTATSLVGWEGLWNHGLQRTPWCVASAICRIKIHQNKMLQRVILSIPENAYDGESIHLQFVCCFVPPPPRCCCCVGPAGPPLFGA